MNSKPLSRTALTQQLKDADSACHAGDYEQALMIYTRVREAAVRPDDGDLLMKAGEGAAIARKYTDQQPASDQPAADDTDLPPATQQSILAPTIDWEPLYAARRRADPIYKLLILHELMQAGAATDPQGSALNHEYREALSDMRTALLATAREQAAALESHIVIARTSLDGAMYAQRCAELEQIRAALCTPEIPAGLAPHGLVAAVLDDLGDAEVQAACQVLTEQHRLWLAEADLVVQATDARSLLERDQTQAAAALLGTMPLESAQWPAVAALHAEIARALVAEPPLPAQTSDDLQRVSDLHDTIKGYLKTLTNDHYKQALATYDQILAYTTLPADLRTQYTHERQQVERDREAYLALYGELMTARQLKDSSAFLVALRKMRNKNVVTFDINGVISNIDLEFSQALAQYRTKIQNTADTYVQQAKAMATEAMYSLDNSHFVQALDLYAKACAELQGVSLDTVVTAAPASAIAERGLDPDLLKDDSETDRAIQGVKDQLLEGRDNELRISLERYTVEMNAIQLLQRKLQRLLPLYNAAEQLTRQQQYAVAADQLAAAMDAGGAPDTTWKRVEDSLKRLKIQWERSALTTADGLLIKSQIARTRIDIEALRTLIEQLQTLEPQLVSSALTEKKAAGVQLLTEALEAEKALQAQVVDVEILLNSTTNYAAVDQQIARLMGQPHLRSEARRLEQQLLRRRVADALQAARQATYGTDSTTIEAQRSHLTQLLHAYSSTLNDQDDGVQIRTQLRTMVDTLTARRAELNADDQRAQERQKRLEKVRRHRDNQEYPQALRLLDEMLAARPDDVTLQLQSEQYRHEWVQVLRGDVEVLFGSAQPPVDILQQKLELIASLLTHPDPDITGQLQRVARMAAKHDGLDAFRKGHYSAAFEYLQQADSHDSEVLANLKRAAWKAGEVASIERRWADAVQLLAQADSVDPQVRHARTRATAEHQLLIAIERRQQQDFEAAGRLLGEVQAAALPEMEPRVTREQERTAQARAAFDLLYIQQRSSGAATRPGLRTALDSLNYVRDQLASDDQLRSESVYKAISTQIQQWETHYQELIASEQAVLLAQGRQASDIHNFIDALHHFQTALDLSLSHNDRETESLIHEAQTRLARQRDQLTETISTFLHSRSTTLAECNRLLAQAQETLNQTPPPDEPLKQVFWDLQQAQKVLYKAEQDLEQVCRSWSVARQKRSPSFNHALEVLSAVRHYFEGHTFIHQDLDVRSTSNLEPLIRQDQQRLIRADTIYQELRELLQHKDILSAISLAQFQQLFDQLRTMQIELANTDTMLHMRLNGTTPTRPLRENDVRQLLELLAARITQVRQHLDTADEIAVYRDTLKEEARLIDLFQRWNVDNEVVLAPRLTTGDATEQRGISINLHIEQLDEQLTSAHSTIEAARLHQASGQQFQNQRQFSLALDSYDQALPLYAAAIATLQELVDQPPVNMLLRHQRDTARMVLKTAQKELQSIDSPEYRPRCQLHARDGQRLLEEAERARNDNKFTIAHQQADEALKEDASLAEKVRIFHASTPRDRQRSRMRLAILLTLGALALALIILVGWPALQQSLAELNPTVVPIVGAFTPTPTLQTSAIQPTPAPVPATVRTSVTVVDDPALAVPQTLFTLDVKAPVIILKFIGAASQPEWILVEAGGQRGWVPGTALTFDGALPAALKQ